LTAHDGNDGDDGRTDVALLRRRRRVLGLLTGIIAERSGVWEIDWVGDGSREPRTSKAPGLTEAADQAATTALALWTVGPAFPDAELQLAIYPWNNYGKMAPMYDITEQDGEYQAHDIVAGSPDIAAPTLEELVEQMALQPQGDQAMLRWVRRFADLSTAALG
jgi:hypothetical protein